MVLDPYGCPAFFISQDQAFRRMYADIHSSRISFGQCKNIAARQRPCWLDPSVELLVPVPKDFSFPSGHSLVSFEGAVCIFLFNRKWGIPALMLAVLTAFSRLYLFVHFPTDVLAGIVMGTVIAWSVVRTAKRQMEKTDRMSGKP